MVRTQVQLTEEQQSALRDLSATTGRSVSDLVRDAVEQAISGAPHVTSPEQIERALRLAGRFASGSPDVSANHDEYLAEAYR
jgi:Arc/MetJ-type ribon-helix-helix transcriptional regulator